MEIIVALIVVGTLVPFGVWLGDEANGRARWRQVLNVRERFSLGEGAFREARVEVTRSEVLRERAPWWIRAVAFTCYVPLSVAIISSLPWLLGVLFLIERTSHHPGFDAQANALLVFAYPPGAWAAFRMAGLGRALLSGDEARFREAQRGAAAVQLALNGVLFLAALALLARYGNRDAKWLFVTPTLTLVHLALVSLAGLSHMPLEGQARPDQAGLDAPTEPRA